MMVIGLASIIIGQTFIRSTRISLTLVAAVVGAIIYRFILTFAIMAGVPSGDLNLLSSAIVIVAIAIPILKRRKVKNA
jgi:putative ABC transport system permease protein